jgi:hypothetical protein
MEPAAYGKRRRRHRNSEKKRHGREIILRLNWRQEDAAGFDGTNKRQGGLAARSAIREDAEKKRKGPTDEQKTGFGQSTRSLCQDFW